jgi:hypothetical protein
VNGYIILPQLRFCKISIEVFRDTHRPREIETEEDWNDWRLFNLNHRVDIISRCMRMPRLTSLALHFKLIGPFLLARLDARGMFPDADCQSCGSLRHLSFAVAHFKRNRQDHHGLYDAIDKFGASLLDRFNTIETFTLSAKGFDSFSPEMGERLARLKKLELIECTDLGISGCARLLSSVMQKEDARLAQIIWKRNNRRDDLEDPDFWTNRMWNSLGSERQLVFS